jgi:hypothetical protein
MTVMRSVFYIPGNNEKMISKAPETPADIITVIVHLLGLLNSKSEYRI